MKKSFFLTMILSLSLTLFCQITNTLPKDKEAILDDIIKCTEQTMIHELERLKAISQKVEIIEDNWNGIKTALLEDSKSRINSLSWFALPDGHYYTVEKNRVSASLANRDYFLTLLDGKPVLGAPIIGKTSGRKSLVVAYPVNRNGVLVGILGTSFYVNDIRKFLLNYICISTDDVFYIVNDDYLTILDSSDPDLSFDKPLEQSSESLRSAIKTIVENEKGNVNYKWNGIKKNAYFKESKLTNWHYVIANHK